MQIRAAVPPAAKKPALGVHLDAPRSITVHSSSVWDRKVLFKPASGQQSALPSAVCAHDVLCASPVYAHEY